MTDYILQNKAAWEFDAYSFWLREVGQPKDRAAKIRSNPIRELKKYANYFDSFEGIRIANICGSCGKKAVPLAVLGADVSVFDISEDNRRYALALADATGVQIDYQVCNVLQIDLEKYGTYFDVVFMEGGILHYFHDIDLFMSKLHSLLKPGGKMICSDFHPFTKISDTLNFEQPTRSYFDTGTFEGEMAHARFYDEDIRRRIPKCVYRKYTVSKIINAVLGCGFILQKFDEHPSWVNSDLPGEFTLIAQK